MCAHPGPTSNSQNVKSRSLLTNRGARQVGGFARFVAPSAASSAQAFGLFTERDLLKVLAAGPRDLRSVPVNEYMTSAADMIWADADFPVFDALQACRPAARTPRTKQVLWCVGTQALPHPAAPPLRHSSSIARTYATCRSWAWRAARRRAQSRPP